MFYNLSLNLEEPIHARAFCPSPPPTEHTHALAHWNQLSVY